MEFSRFLLLVCLTAAALMALSSSSSAEAKGKKKKKKEPKKTDDKDLFTSDTLKCLVCENLVDEFLSAVHRVDPKKMVDTGTFRINGKGEQQRSVIPFARSQQHLMELVDKVCENFEDYAQGKWKSDGTPAIIRLTTPEGNMNPRFGEVDLVPDDDLNTRLKFYCESIVEDMEESFTELLADEANDEVIKDQVCFERGEYCPRFPQKKNKKNKKEEL